jgi:Sugar phosphate isomerases/epimerases
MKLSISNIAWSSEYDYEMYRFLQTEGIYGLEIAPTRIFPIEPYKDIVQAISFSNELKLDYGISISSMQSIWYGIKENLFNSIEERNFLLDYTKKAIDFAKSIDSKNLVFGCPQNRNMSEKMELTDIINWFSEVGRYALENNTVFALEPNPSIYGTNFINSTIEAFEMVKRVNCHGFKVNLDVGTMVFNNEDLSEIEPNVELINHIHISEPGLALIEKHRIHKELRDILKRQKYNGYISAEMKCQENIDDVKSTLLYLKEVFE